MISYDTPITEKAKNIKLLVLDIDGVFTNAKVLYGPDGQQSVSFNIQDGLGINLLQQSGVQVAVISGRNIPAVHHRMRDLNVKHVHLGITEKLPVYNELLQKLELSAEHVAYVGDDILDITVMQASGFAIAVANARPEVKQIAHWCTNARGGKGAVREVCDLILATQKTS